MREVHTPTPSSSTEAGGVWGGGEERGVKKKGGQPKTNGDMCFFTFNVFFVLLELSFSEVFFL